MTARIVINDREINNPFARLAIIFASMLVAGLVMAGVVFVILPLVGITVALSISFVFAIVVASMFGVLVLLVFSMLYALFRGSIRSSTGRHKS